MSRFLRCDPSVSQYPQSQDLAKDPKTLAADKYHVAHLPAVENGNCSFQFQCPGGVRSSFFSPTTAHASTRIRAPSRSSPTNVSVVVGARRSEVLNSNRVQVFHKPTAIADAPPGSSGKRCASQHPTSKHQRPQELDGRASKAFFACVLISEPTTFPC